MGLSPTAALENILIYRAFSWENIVELDQNRLELLESVKLVIIAEFTSFLPNHDKSTIKNLLQAIDGMKRTFLKSNPLFILTAPLNKDSEFKPDGVMYYTN